MRIITKTMAVVALASAFLAGYAAAQPAAIQVKTLLQTEHAWNGNTYRAYPTGQPQMTVVEITIPAKTTMDWHRHPMPNAAYVLSGTIRVETKDGHSAQFDQGQIIPETVATTHRGVTLDKPVKLLVFYAGADGLPLSQVEPK
jgi:quercetin dioxygenase-like cupin family protein